MSSNIALSKEDIVFPYQENGYAHKCFPVRNIRRFKPDDGGAWLVEYKAEKERQLEGFHKHVNTGKKKREKSSKRFKELTGFLLTKEFHLDDPADLFSINISGKQLHSVRNEDFSLFVNVSCIEAGDNHLDLEIFKTFCNLEELQLQLNRISNISITHREFQCLKRLDLSYNHLNEEALLDLGKLRKLKELTLRGCSLTNLPPELSRAYLISDEDAKENGSKAERKRRFPELEYLDLAENSLTNLSTFASLAGLRKLKTLNLSSNKIYGVPHLRLLVEHHQMSASTCVCRSSLDTDHINISEKNTVKESSGVDGMDKVEVISSNVECTNGKKVGEKHCETAHSDESIINNEHTPHTGSANLQFPTPLNRGVENNMIYSGADKEDGNIFNDSVHSDISACNSKQCSIDENNEAIDMISERDDLFEIKELDIETTLNELDDYNDLLGNCNTPKSLIEEDNDIKENNVYAEDADHVFLGNKNVDDTCLDDANLFKEINFALNDLDDQNDVPFTLNGKDPLSIDDVEATEKFKDPFPRLKVLDLSYNLIAAEETLLALTSWPMLQDLKLWGNPLMNVFKGTPPIIGHHLENLCGIKVHKKEPQSYQMSHSIGPSIAKSAKVYRVKTRLPPIKRNNLLMIEDAIQKAVESSENNKTVFPAVDGIESKQDTEKTIPCDDYEESEGIFMTQLAEDFDDHGDKQQKEHKEETSDSKILEEQYFDYNALLKIDETYGPESEIPIPSTVYGSVQALRQMLKNPLIFKEGNSNKRNHLNSLQGKKVKSLAVLNERDDKLGVALDYIRTKETTYGENLATVLHQYGKSNEMKEKFPDVKEIMKRVQDKYDKVRLESLRPISVAQAELSRMSTRADKHSQDLILMRMKQGRIGDMYSSSRNTGSPRMKSSNAVQSGL